MENYKQMTIKEFAEMVVHGDIYKVNYDFQYIGERLGDSVALEKWCEDNGPWYGVHSVNLGFDNYCNLAVGYYGNGYSSAISLFEDDGYEDNEGDLVFAINIVLKAHEGSDVTENDYLVVQMTKPEWEKIQQINSIQAYAIIMCRYPLGKYWLEEQGRYIGIDNTDGNAWVEEFYSFEECKKWMFNTGEDD